MHNSLIFGIISILVVIIVSVLFLTNFTIEQEKIVENVFYYGKQCINATLPTCFIEIEYKTSDSNYLITHEVFLYEEDYPTLKDLEAYKEKVSYGFASQYSQELEDVVTAFHMGYGCECLSSGDY